MTPAATNQRLIIDEIEGVWEYLGYIPSPEQAEVLNTDGRFLAISGGEQVGKSFTVTYLVIRLILTYGRPVLVWLVGRKYDSSEMEFAYLLDNFTRLGMVRKFSGSQPDKPRYIELKNGARIETLSVAEVMNIGKKSPDIIVGCEASQLGHETHIRLRTRAASSAGYLLYSGTFERGQGWYKQLCERYQVADEGRRMHTLPSWSNPHRYPGGRNDPEILALERELSEEEFAERIAGVIRKPFGLVFGREFDFEKHVRDIEYIPGIPVDLAVDPGYNQSAHSLSAIQRVPDQPLRVFDEIYDPRYSTEEIIDEAMSRPWWADVPDGTAVIDIAGTRNLGSTDAASDVWLKKAHIVMRSKQVPIMAGIDRMKNFLRLDPLTLAPRIVWAPCCQGALSEFGSMVSPVTGRTAAWSWKTNKQGDIIGKTPSEQNCHSLKAIYYYLIAIYGFYHADPPTNTYRHNNYKWRKRNAAEVLA